jgi:hypothetical protein
MVSDDLIRVLDATIDQLVATDSSLGPHSVLVATESHGGTVHDLCNRSRGSSRRGLLPVAARSCEFAGWLHHDAGHRDRALGEG